jgi:U11/U12 small nuclear ribonucleoprotein SNRNP25
MSSFEDNIRSDLSHNQLIDLIDENIRSLIRNDPLFNELPIDITTHELENIISQQFGRSFVVFVNKQNNSCIRVIVDIESNVQQLKKSIQKQFSIQYKREKNKFKTRINWRYVWKTYCLVFDNQKLDNDFIKIKDLGISNNSQISFAKKYNK